MQTSVSLAGDSLGIIEVMIIVNLGMVTAPDMRMHHVLIILTLTFPTPVNYYA